MLQYELEKETNFCPPDNENVTTEDLLTHMKKTNDELLNKAKKYKSACETKERIISDMRVERKREVRDFYYNVLVGHSRSATILRKALSEQ